MTYREDNSWIFSEIDDLIDCKYDEILEEENENDQRAGSVEIIYDFRESRRNNKK